MDETLMLRALAVVIGDEPLRERFLALTGYDGDTLRARIAEPDVLSAVQQFLGGHEPDLLHVADTLGVKPESLCARC